MGLFGEGGGVQLPSSVEQINNRTRAFGNGREYFQTFNVHGTVL